MGIFRIPLKISPYRANSDIILQEKRTSMFALVKSLHPPLLITFAKMVMKKENESVVLDKLCLKYFSLNVCCR